jgi:hypothetical protein
MERIRIKIYFHGATGDVTGSACHVKTKHGTFRSIVACSRAAKKPAIEV